MTGPTIEGAALDHVAHAVPRWQDAWHRYAVDLGAAWSSGGPGVGFAPGQVQFANGARIEMLMPYAVETNDFLSRFLTRHGPGPHHLTFKVPDLDAALESLVHGGYQPIGIDRSDPQWMEAFVHPNQATGVVVQVAQAGSVVEEPPSRRLPEGTTTTARRLGSGTTGLAHLGSTRCRRAGGWLGSLCGRPRRADHRRGQRYRLSMGRPELGRSTRAPAPLPHRRDRPASPLRTWLGDRPGRIHHLELSVAEPDTLPGARDLGILPGSSSGEAGRGSTFEIPPEENAGMRLIVRAG